VGKTVRPGDEESGIYEWRWGYIYAFLNVQYVCMFMFGIHLCFLFTSIYICVHFVFVCFFILYNIYIYIYIILLSLSKYIYTYIYIYECMPVCADMEGIFP
jgi:hypothetical protein